METALLILLYLLLLAATIAGLFLNILGLPGIWLIVLGTIIYALLTGLGVYVGWTVILVLVGMGILAELIEFVAGAAGSKAAGGSKRGMIGAIVGAIAGGLLGTPILPIIGTIIGSILGAFAGAFAIELLIGRTTGTSAHIGIGAAKGRAIGILVKSILGAAMAAVALIAALPFWGGDEQMPTTIPATQAIVEPIPTTLPSPE